MYKTWILRSMQHNFNIAFPKILLNRSSNFSLALFLQAKHSCNVPQQFMTLSQSVLSQKFQLKHINHITFWKYSKLTDYILMIKENNHHDFTSRFALYLDIFHRQRISVFPYTFYRLDKGIKMMHPSFITCFHLQHWCILVFICSFVR